ncbi:MAG: hypothetical protein ACYC1C_07535, partial [Chloroflexota bacterium]
RHARLAFHQQGRKAALNIRKHLIAYSRGSPIAVDLRLAVEHIHSLEDVALWIAEWEASFRGQRQGSLGLPSAVGEDALSAV